MRLSNFQDAKAESFTKACTSRFVTRDLRGCQQTFCAPPGLFMLERAAGGIRHGDTGNTEGARSSETLRATSESSVVNFNALFTQEGIGLVRPARPLSAPSNRGDRSRIQAFARLDHARRRHVSCDFV